MTLLFKLQIKEDLSKPNQPHKKVTDYFKEAK